MKNAGDRRLSNRVLKINVGFLLSDGPGHIQESELDIPAPIQVADDLIIHHLQGKLRLSRTKEGILVQATLRAGVDNQCSYCLEQVPQEVPLKLEELYSHPRPLNTEFYVGDDGILDLAPLIRAEAIMETAWPVSFKSDEQGNCQHCGLNMQAEFGLGDSDDIDPRLAKLKELLDQNE